MGLQHAMRKGPTSVRPDSLFLLPRADKILQQRDKVPLSGKSFLTKSWLWWSVARALRPARWSTASRDVRSRHRLKAMSRNLSSWIGWR